MEKLVNFWKKNYRVLIPIMVVIVLLITVYFLYREYKYDTYRNKQDNEVYQYFGGMKKEYTAVLTYDLNNRIIDVGAKNEKIQYDATPIYFTDTDKILFPKEMSIIFPLKDGSQYRLYKYTTYEKLNDIYMLKMDNQEFEYNYFFLYDGSNLYFFPDKTDLYINDKKIIELSENSYVQVVGGYTLTYYDKESDSSKVIELTNDKVYVKNDKMTVNLNDAIGSVGDKDILLFAPQKLNALTQDK